MNGQVRQRGAGRAFWYWRPSTSIVRIPTATIDALFAPLPAVESRGRAWLYVDKQLKPLNLRLGITDGTNTEVLSPEAQPGMEVATGVTGLGTTRNTAGQQGTGNPLMPQRGGPGRGR